MAPCLDSVCELESAAMVISNEHIQSNDYNDRLGPTREAALAVEAAAAAYPAAKVFIRFSATGERV